MKAPLETKVAFLKKKGLSDAEIDLAIKQSEVIIQSRVRTQSCFNILGLLIGNLGLWS